MNSPKEKKSKQSGMDNAIELPDLEKKRIFAATRQTKETKIDAQFNLDGSGKSEITFPSGFFTHMLETFALWGRFDIELSVSGDTYVDLHHAVEDSGLVLGDCFNKAAGNKKGIARSAHAYIAMDEALARVVVDISGRPWLSMTGEFPETVIYNSSISFQTSLAEDFWQAFCAKAGITLHIDLLKARSSHHALECIFKAAGRALNLAVNNEFSRRAFYSGNEGYNETDVLSAKGVIE